MEISLGAKKMKLRTSFGPRVPSGHPWSSSFFAYIPKQKQSTKHTCLIKKTTAAVSPAGEARGWHIQRLSVATLTHPPHSHPARASLPFGPLQEPSAEANGLNAVRLAAQPLSAAALPLRELCVCNPAAPTPWLRGIQRNELRLRLQLASRLYKTQMFFQVACLRLKEVF